MVTETEIREALTQVNDPELGFNIVDLGLVYGIEQQDGTVQVKMTLTSPGCPAGPEIIEQVRETIASLDGVSNVDINLVFSPPWTPERISEDLRWVLGF